MEGTLLARQVGVMLLDTSVRILVVLILAGAANGLLRRYSAGARHAVWAAALMAVLALPLLGRVAPAVPLALPQAGPAAPLLVNEPERPVVSSPTVAETPLHLVRSDAAYPARPAAPSPDFWTWVVALWLAGSVVSFARLAGGLLQVRQLASRCRRAHGALAARMVVPNFGESAPVLIAREGEKPFPPLTCGVWRPCILLPAHAAEWSDETLRSVLLHEVAHVRRGDTATQILARLIRAIYWFHPAVWWMEGRLRLEAERACDESVLRAGVRASDYAAVLLEITRMLQPKSKTPLAVAMVSSSGGEEPLALRVRSVLSPDRPRRSVLAAGVVLALVTSGAWVVGAVRVSAASQTPSATPPVSQAGPTPAAETTVSQPPRGEMPRMASASTESARTREALKRAEAEVRRARAEAAKARAEAAAARAEAQKMRAELEHPRGAGSDAKAHDLLRQELQARELEQRQRDLRDQLERLKLEQKSLQDQEAAAKARYEAGIGPVDELSRARLDRERAMIDLKSAEERIQQLQRSRKAPTRRRFVEDELARSRAEVQKAMAELNATEAALNVEQARYQAGSSTKVELERAAAAREQAKLTVVQAERHLLEAQAELARDQGKQSVEQAERHLAETRAKLEKSKR